MDNIELEDLDLRVPSDNYNELLLQIQDSPSLYVSYALKLEDIKDEKNEILLKIKIAEAIISQNLRVANPKISEAKIDRMLWNDKSYIALQTNLNTIKAKEGKLHAVVKGIDQRHALLISASHLIQKELRKLS